MDACDRAVGKAVGQSVERDTIVGIVEGWHQHEAVADIEVRIAGGQALVFEDHRCRHWQRANLKRLAIEVAQVTQALEIFGQRQVIFISGIRLDCSQDCVRADEARDIVDVPMRVVARATAVQPKHLLDAEILAEGLLQLRFGDAGIALLHLAEQALFCRQQQPCAVSVNGAAFEHKAVFCAIGERRPGLDCGHRVEFGNVLWNQVVVAPVAVLGPAVEAPVGDGQVVAAVSFVVVPPEGDLLFGGHALHEDRPGIPQPDAICTPVVKMKARHVGPLPPQHPRYALFDDEIVHEDVYLLNAGKPTNDLAIHPGDGLELAWPVQRVMRPGDPGGSVGSPFGGHAKAQGRIGGL